jgi:predicted transcriptional regulator
MAAVIQQSVQELDAREGHELLDRQARRHLGMSAEEFRRAWQAGELDPEADPNVARVAMLLPFDGANSR